MSVFCRNVRLTTFGKKATRYLYGFPGRHIHFHRILCTHDRLMDSSNNNNRSHLWNKIVDFYSNCIKRYEQFIGLEEVKHAQEKAVKAEIDFDRVQKEAKAKRRELQDIQIKLKQIRAKLDKLQRTDDSYIELLSEEVPLIKQEYELERKEREMEESVRISFSALQSTLRESREKEKLQDGYTKYRSFLLTICTAILGVLTALISYARHHSLRNLITEQSKQNADLQRSILELLSVPGVSASSDLIKSNSSEKVQTEITKMLDLIIKQIQESGKEIQEMKEKMARFQVLDKDGDVVHVGTNVEGLLKQTESNLEYKMNRNALWTVTLVSGAFALTMYIVSKGS